MNTSTSKGRRLGGKSWLVHVLSWSMWLGLWCQVCQVGLADGALPEYQVKALYLLNFTKYVEWPANAFAGGDTPITIGLYGESKLGEALKSAEPGKTLGGRALVIRQVESPDDLSQCHILFISGAEPSRFRQIIAKI